MKLLVDENLPSRLVTVLEPHFPGTTHVKQVSLMESDDMDVWNYAHGNGFSILSKDKDFQQLSVLRGAPPKVVWLRIGNTTASRMAELVAREVPAITDFLEHPHRSLLILSTIP